MIEEAGLLVDVAPVAVSVFFLMVDNRKYGLGEAPCSVTVAM